MSELRAYMLQRAKVPAKVHAMDALKGPDRFSSAQSDRVPSSPPRVVLPRMDNHFAPHNSGSLAAIATSGAQSSPARRKSRPYSEPRLEAQKSTSSKHHLVPSNRSTKYHTARSASTLNSSTNTALRRCRHPQYGSGGTKAGTSRDNSRAGTYKTARSARSKGSTVYADENNSAVSHASQAPNYGKVPRYIQKMKSDRLREKQRAQEEADKIVPPVGFRQVSEEERLRSLAHLTKQKEKLEAELYRRAPFRAETLGQQSRERKLNDSTKRVEEGIRLFSKEIVFVPADCDPLTSVLPHTRGKDESNDDGAGDSFLDEDRYSSVKQYREPDSHAPVRQAQNATEFEGAHRPSAGHHSRNIEKKSCDDIPAKKKLLTHKKERAAHPSPFASNDRPLPPPPPEPKNRAHSGAHYDDYDADPAPLPRDHTPACLPYDCGASASPEQRYSQGSRNNRDRDETVGAQPSPSRRREPPFHDDSDSVIRSRNDWAKANRRFEWERRIDEEDEDAPKSKKEALSVKKMQADTGKHTAHHEAHGGDNEMSREQMQRKGMGMEGRKIGQPPGGRSSINLQWD